MAMKTESLDSYLIKVTETWSTGSRADLPSPERTRQTTRATARPTTGQPVQALQTPHRTVPHYMKATESSKSRTLQPIAPRPAAAPTQVARAHSPKFYARGLHSSDTSKQAEARHEQDKTRRAHRAARRAGEALTIADSVHYEKVHPRLCKSARKGTHQSIRALIQN